MSQFHNVFCRSEGVLTRRELAGYAFDAWYGDESPSFSPAENDRASDDADWREFTITLPSARRPVLMIRDIDQETVSTLVEEVLDECDADLAPSLVAHLRNTRWVMGIEIFPEYLDEDAWELLDQVQAFLAQRFDGLIVTDDGIYDQHLERMVER